MSNVQYLPDPVPFIGYSVDYGSYATYPTGVKTYTGTNDIIYGYHNEWAGQSTNDPNPSPESFAVTWSSAGNYATCANSAVVDAATLNMEYPWFFYWNGYAPQLNFAAGSSHTSYYPTQDNGSGTTIGFGAAMTHFVATDHSDPSDTNSAPLDANINTSGPLGTNAATTCFMGYLLTKPLNSTGGGYISNGGTTTWLTNGVPIAVNSAGQVLGLSTLNTATVAGMLPGQNPAWSGAPYYSTTNAYTVPTIWTQTNSGGAYVPVTLAMPQPGLGFSGASIAYTPPYGFSWLQSSHPTMFFNTNLQIAGGQTPQVEVNPPATNLCDPPYLWQNYQYHRLGDFFPGYSNYAKFQVTGIADSGAITAIATPSSPSGASQEIVQLVQMDLVTQTAPGSGLYQHIDEATIFPADNGVGCGPPANQSTPKGIFITLNADLTTAAVGSMTASMSLSSLENDPARPIRWQMLPPSAK